MVLQDLPWRASSHPQDPALPSSASLNLTASDKRMIPRSMAIHGTATDRRAIALQQANSDHNKGEVCASVNSGDHQRAFENCHGGCFTNHIVGEWVATPSTCMAGGHAGQAPPRRDACPGFSP